MSFYVYIIANKDSNDLYKGFTENPLQRLADHNAGKSKFTSNSSGWYFVFLAKFDSKRDALIFEKKIKRYNRTSLMRLINAPENLLQQFLLP